MWYELFCSLSQREAQAIHPKRSESTNADLVAISNYLGDKKYFFGRDHATLVDCTIFGHLSQMIYIPLDFPQKKFMNENCQNILSFMERFREEHWSDWDEKCERKANQGLVNENKKSSGFPFSSALAILFVSIFLYRVSIQMM